MDIFLQFHDAYLENDKLYFSTKNMNGFFCYDLVSKETEMIATFDGETLWGKNVHQQIIAYHDCLYFIPFMGSGISRFNLNTKEMDYIELFEKETNTIAGAFLLEDRILLVPMKRPQLLYLDLKTNRLENVHIAGLEEMTQKHCESNVLFDLQGTCLIGNQLILVLYGQNYYLAVDLDSMEPQKYVLGEEEKLDNVFFDGESLWINSVSDPSVFRIAYRTHEVKKYNINIEEQCDCPFFSVEKAGNKIVLMPHRENTIYCFDNEQDRWIKVSLNDSDKIERKDSKCMLFWRTIEYNNEILMLPEAEDGIWVMDKDLRFQRKIILNCSEAVRQREYINREYYNYALENSGPLMEENLSLSDYLKCLESGTQMLMDKEFCIGNVIYDRISVDLH